MIRSLRGYRILAGARGQKAVDLDALAGMIARVSELPFEYPEILEIDLNPVFASPAGAVTGDVRIIRRLGQVQDLPLQPMARWNHG